MRRQCRHLLLVQSHQKMTAGCWYDCRSEVHRCWECLYKPERSSIKHGFSFSCKCLKTFETVLMERVQLSVHVTNCYFAYFLIAGCSATLLVCTAFFLVCFAVSGEICCLHSGPTDGAECTGDSERSETHYPRAARGDSRAAEEIWLSSAIITGKLRSPYA